MKTFLEFEQKRKELEASHGSNYIIFVGPHNLEILDDQKLYEYYVWRQVNTALDSPSNGEKYDIFFVKRTDFSNPQMRRKITYLRLSKINLSDI